MLEVVMKRGEIEPKEFLYVDVDEAGNEVPIDLSAATLTAVIQSKDGGWRKELTVTGNAQGEITVLTGATSDWPVGEMHWDIKIEFSPNHITSLPKYGPAIWKVTQNIA